jgi:hypothetical protein
LRVIPENANGPREVARTDEKLRGCRELLDVPAKAGTHNHGNAISAPTVSMDSRFRGNGSKLIKRISYYTAGAGSPACVQAACSVLTSKHTIVIGPTPPGTGVMAPATLTASA